MGPTSQQAGRQFLLTLLPFGYIVLFATVQVLLVVVVVEQMLQVVVLAW